jgi:chromosomal replication initiation ATPase DnaA
MPLSIQRSTKLRPPLEIEKELVRRGLLEALSQVCADSGAAPRAVLSGSRRQSVSRARHTFWMLLHRIGLSRKEISILFGCDHSSVSYALSGSRKIFA